MERKQDRGGNMIRNPDETYVVPGPVLVEEVRKELDKMRAFPDRYVINTVTGLAGRIRRRTKEDVKNVKEMIERRIYTAATDHKLPLCYLLDSVVKNVADPFRAVFAPSVVKLLTTAYVQVDDKDKLRLRHLFSSWEERKIFSREILEEIKVFLSAFEIPDLQNVPTRPSSDGKFLVPEWSTPPASTHQPQPPQTLQSDPSRQYIHQPSSRPRNPAQAPIMAPYERSRHPHGGSRGHMYAYSQGSPHVSHAPNVMVPRVPSHLKAQPHKQPASKRKRQERVKPGQKMPSSKPKVAKTEPAMKEIRSSSAAPVVALSPAKASKASTVSVSGSSARASSPMHLSTSESKPLKEPSYQPSKPGQPDQSTQLVVQASQGLSPRLDESSPQNESSKHGHTLSEGPLRAQEPSSVEDQSPMGDPSPTEDPTAEEGPTPMENESRVQKPSHTKEPSVNGKPAMRRRHPRRPHIWPIELPSPIQFPSLFQLPEGITMEALMEMTEITISARDQIIEKAIQKEIDRFMNMLYDNLPEGDRVRPMSFEEMIFLFPHLAKSMRDHVEKIVKTGEKKDDPIPALQNILLIAEEQEEKDGSELPSDKSSPDLKSNQQVCFDSESDPSEIVKEKLSQAAFLKNSESRRKSERLPVLKQEMNAPGKATLDHSAVLERPSKSPQTSQHSQSRLLQHPQSSDRKMHSESFYREKNERGIRRPRELDKSYRGPPMKKPFRRKGQGINSRGNHSGGRTAYRSDSNASSFGGSNRRPPMSRPTSGAQMNIVQTKRPNIVASMKALIYVNASKMDLTSLSDFTKCFRGVINESRERRVKNISQQVLRILEKVWAQVRGTSNFDINCNLSPDGERILPNPPTYEIMKIQKQREQERMQKARQEHEMRQKHNQSHSFGPQGMIPSQSRSPFTSSNLLAFPPVNPSLPMARGLIASPSPMTAIHHAGVSSQGHQFTMADQAQLGSDLHRGDRALGRLSHGGGEMMENWNTLNDKGRCSITLRSFLYNNSYFQCQQDGLRFKTQQELGTHLDILFRRNKAKKDRALGAESRVYFCTLDQWITNFKNLAEGSAINGDGSSVTNVDGVPVAAGNDINGVSTSFAADSFKSHPSEISISPQGGEGHDGPKSHQQNRTKSASERDYVRFDSAVMDNSCGICKEKFDEAYDEELNDWVIRHAVMDPHTKKIVHRLCLEASRKPENFQAIPAVDEAESGGTSTMMIDDLSTSRVPSQPSSNLGTPNAAYSTTVSEPGGPPSEHQPDNSTGSGNTTTATTAFFF